MAHRYKDFRPQLLPAGVRLALLLAVAAIALLAPLTIYPLFLVKVLCFMLFAAALNLVLGFAGLLSLGHAAFFGGAAYAFAQSAKVWGWPFEVSLLFGVLVGGALGLVFGLIAIRRQGIYFTMITLALAQMVYFLAVQAPFTGGEDGIQNVPRGSLLGLIDLRDTTTLYYAALIIVTACLLLIRRVVHSPFGHILGAIRENEARVTSLGLDVDRYKLQAFTLSAALSGLAGALKASAFQLATLADVSWHISGEVVLMVLIGGIGTLWGPLIGAIFVVMIGHFLATSGLPVSLVVGVVFMACVMLFRRGFYGETLEYLRRRLLRDIPARTETAP
ncbi:branched-chain amino acid ABC transporter permease [Paracoccus denitrificans]|uniref:branched-chain amino acid ABC transporter permease n=1 Tax=Paracoccus denitrificans TaxID=266 RepID=UPI001E449EA3|nr:branched-chain amino acid ABC transporter permease [Paracoccus denitrificans]UFS67344.1 branched-chain amino acid ABC transporter permease [Paracoccus denitrificans]